MAWCSFLNVSRISDTHRDASYRWKFGRFIFENVPNWCRANTVVVFDVLGYQSRDDVSTEMRDKTAFGRRVMCDRRAGLR